jgi:hypothetical protein
VKSSTTHSRLAAYNTRSVVHHPLRLRSTQDYAAQLSIVNAVWSCLPSDIDMAGMIVPCFY